MSNKVVFITSKMMGITLASIFAGVYDGHAESLTKRVRLKNIRNLAAWNIDGRQFILRLA
ncbi:MAG: hypothetical protein VB142_05005 [Burkholderia sp.]